MSIRTHRFRLTPDRLILSLLIAECLLWLSNWLGWPAWHKGYAVLTCVAMVGLGMIAMLGWFLVAVFFRWRFQFGIRTLLLLVVVVAVPCSWFAVERRQRSQTLEGKAEAAIDQILDGHTLESLECSGSGINLRSFRFAPDECRELIEVFRQYVRSCRSTIQPSYPNKNIPAAYGTAWIGFHAHRQPGEFTGFKYALWLDDRSLGTNRPSSIGFGSIGFIRLTVQENETTDFFLAGMPLYPADLSRVKDAIERARNRQRSGTVLPSERSTGTPLAPRLP